MASARVLIVEDEIIVARDLEVRLNAMGYEPVGITPSGSEAIRLVEELKPDLVLMDVVLRGDLDGIEAASEIRKRSRVAVIYLTAYADTRTLERAKLTEPFAYLVKPFSEWELHANIEMALYRYRMETRLRRMEDWFKATFSGVADAVIATNGGNLITMVNSAAEAITGWERNEVVGRPLSDVLRLRRRETGEHVTFDEVSEGPLVCLAGDTLLLDRSEHPIPIDSTTSALRDPEDRLHGTITVFRDAAGRRHGALVRMGSEINLAIGESEALDGMLQLVTESVVRNLDVAFARIWTVDAGGRNLILRASAGCYTHLDGPHSRIPVGDLKIGRIAQERKAHVTNDVPNDPWIGDRDWATREKMRAFAGYPLLIGGEMVGVLAVFSRHAITETGLEALASAARSAAIGIQRKKLEEQYRQSQKMEAVGQLAGGVAHDFNNLLTVILGHAQVMLSRGGLGEENVPKIEEIRRAGERASALTRQLLAFGRRQVMEPQLLDLNLVIRDVEKMLLRVIGENIDLETNLAPGLNVVKADPGQIEQVLMNLVVNARDAMPEGGELRITTSNVSVGPGFLDGRPGLRAGSYVRIEVSDTGSGMPPEVRRRIFEPFFTTKGPERGTGLGLATVYGIVTQTGGHISVYSEPGLGTTFRVYLPVTDERGFPLHRRREEPREVSGGNEVILLVEDEEAVRAVAHDTLVAYGYTVLLAENGEEALAVGAGAGHIDLVLTDVIMPKLNGRRLVERLSRERPGIRHLFMSGYADDDIFRRGMVPAGTPFLAKPFTVQALAAKVRGVLDSPPPPALSPEA